MNTNLLTIKYLTILFLFIFTLSCSTGNKEEKAADNPKEEATISDTDDTKNVSFEERDYDLPNQMASQNDDMEYIWDKFYPIGWSEDGKFAYVVEPVDEATGFYFIKIAIQDLNSDKILWKFEYTIKDEIEDKDFETTWKEKYEEIKAKLNEHKIVQQKELQLGKADFNNKKNNFKLKIEAEKIASDEFQGLEMLNKFAIKLSTSSLGSKTIFNLKELSESRLIDALVVGQLKSPHEDKIAVLISTEQIGYEGPPNVISYSIIGANLEKGFKK